MSRISTKDLRTRSSIIDVNRHFAAIFTRKETMPAVQKLQELLDFIYYQVWHSFFSVLFSLFDNERKHNWYYS